MNPQTAQRPSLSRLYLTAADHGRPLSLDEFFAADYEGGHRYELIHGRLEVSPVPDMPHDRLRTWIRRCLERYAEQRPEVCNYVTEAGRLLLSTPGAGVSAPEPDVTAYQGVPLDLPIDEVNWGEVSAYLVVEIISPDTADKDLDRNVPLYLEVPSIREYWIIDPRASYDCPSLIVYRRRGKNWQKPIVVEAGETYTTRLLPGLTLVVDPHA